MLTCAVTGGIPEPAIQWTKDGADVAGATSATLTIDDVIANEGNYACRATNDAGSVESTPVQIATRELTTLLAKFFRPNFFTRS